MKMETGTLYYTDGHQVTITDSGFKVKNTVYRLNGITRHRFSVIHPKRIPSTILIIIGTIGFACGAMNFIPNTWSTSVNVWGFSLIINSIIMVGGTIFFLAGVFIMLNLKKKYAVKIFTAEGERNVVISHSREYISQILDALNRAFADLMDTKSEKMNP